MRIIGFVLVDEDVSALGPSVETGANVPGQREVNPLPDEGILITYYIYNYQLAAFSFIRLPCFQDRAGPCGAVVRRRGGAG